MTSTLAALQALDPAVLAPFVRQAKQRPDLDVTDFDVRVLSVKGVMSQDGLFLFSGHAQAPAFREPWSLVLKILRKPDPNQGQPLSREPQELWYWKREAMVFQSGLLSTLPGPVAVPQFYGLTEREDQVWVWMEHVVETTGPEWHLGHYAQAARQLGRFNAAYLTGTPLPDHPWLLRDLERQWSTFFNPEHAWNSASVQEFFPPALRERVMRLWAERETFYDTMYSLPQVFSHFDFHRRNLMIRGEEVVALDWAWCGTGPVGGDLAPAIGAACLLGDSQTVGIQELEDVTFAAYVEGLRDAGWMGDQQAARLGYLISVALHFGIGCPTLTAFWSSTDESRERAAELCGGTMEEIAARWAGLCEYSLDRADEARSLLHSTGTAEAAAPAL